MPWVKQAPHLWRTPLSTIRRRDLDVPRSGARHLRLIDDVSVLNPWRSTGFHAGLPGRGGDFARDSHGIRWRTSIPLTAPPTGVCYPPFGRQRDLSDVFAGSGELRENSVCFDPGCAVAGLRVATRRASIVTVLAIMVC